MEPKLVALRWRAYSGSNSQGLVPVASFRYHDTIEMGSEDLIAKDSLNKRDTEWHEHAQSVGEIPYID
jgi:hypothetical protein